MDLVPVLLTILSFCGLTAAVDTENGERVGGCPTNIQSIPFASQCSRDSDCSNPIQKCCQAGSSSFKVCAFPIPACRDGIRIPTGSILDGTCAELASRECIDRGCEDGPQGSGGWKAACCGGYAFEWAGTPRPTCGNGVDPLRDSENKLYWCNEDSVRPCPQNSACKKDPQGYEICCPTTTPTTPECTPGEYIPRGSPCTQCLCGSNGRLTSTCYVVDCLPPVCPTGSYGVTKPDKCCEYDCVVDACRFAACVQGYPVCDPDSDLETSYAPGACCPTYRCLRRGCRDTSCVQGHPACDQTSELETTYAPGACCPTYRCVPKVQWSAIKCARGQEFTSPERPCQLCRCGPDGRPSSQPCSTAPGCSTTAPSFVCRPGESYFLGPCMQCRCNTNACTSFQNCVW